MGKNRKKDMKAQRAKRAAGKGALVNDLPVKDATAVKGGRKAGGTQENYLQYTLSDVQVSSN